MTSINSLPLFHLINHPLQEPPAGTRPPLLLLLHGLHGDAYDLYGLASLLDPRFCVLSLRAPFFLRPDGYAWSEVQYTTQGVITSPEQVEFSRQKLIAFVEQAPVAHQADPEQVYLMGFSQGAIMSLVLAVTRPDLLGGVVAMSGRTLAELFDEDAPLNSHLAPVEQLVDFPLLVVHGRWDPVLPIAYGRATRDRFTHLPVELTYREYDMDHTISEDSLRDVGEWLSARLNERQ